MTFQNMHHDQRPMGSPPPVDPECFASRVPARRPVWKLHPSLGRARAAVAYTEGRKVRGGEVWRLADGQWQLMHTVESGTSALDLSWRSGDYAS
ncbi:hypothetical protein [Lentzea sp. CC55]|uniref:hypothetical protein n=1 Tax=Lentzea sp. CC55 TaxID=2884909 RepID=UPI001F3F0150|nr:hypothetical protein [Lentzea sp. CC55]MCG8926683.1 hypothetical protein [Lentzea sp. CC55]